MADFIQNGGSNGGSYASYFSAILSVWEGAYDESTNTRTLGYKLVLRSGRAGRFGDYSASFNVAFDGNIVTQEVEDIHHNRIILLRQFVKELRR